MNYPPFPIELLLILVEVRVIVPQPPRLEGSHEGISFFLRVFLVKVPGLHPFPFFSVRGLLLGFSFESDFDPGRNGLVKLELLRYVIIEG